MQPLVSFERQPDYAAGAVKEAMLRLLAPLGGMNAFVKRGDRVVLKPNLVMGFSPERAVTTHPAVFAAAAELALDCGARVAAGDSPGAGSCRAAAAKSGLAEVAERLGVELLEFTRAECFSEKRTFKKLRLARELLEADVVVNLPKLKTHGQMFMTMAVKNLFGSVVGPEKFQWHYRAGRDTATFATMLYEICRAVNPALTIVDAIVAMDGNGPSSGTPNPLGFLAAGADPCAVDAALLDLLGLPREKLPTLQAAARAGDIAWRETTAVGDDPAGLRPARWTMPETHPLHMVGIAALHRIPLVSRLIKAQVTAKPAPKPTCIRCGACARLCPAGAIVMSENGVEIDRKKCIYCYCCHELCPHGAMGLRKSLLLRLLGGFRRR